jgi:CRP/FNR family transcriptional regulator, cyclic AMP receptor protein
MKDLERSLAEHPFFSTLDVKYLDAFAKEGKRVSYASGKFVFREGDEAGYIYFIQKGKVALEVHTPQGPVIIETLSAGDVLGWSWVVPPYRKSFDARCAEDVEAVAVSASAIRDQMESDCEMGYAVLKQFTSIVAQRLQATRLQLIDVYSAR